jgi:hypothetical protein
MGSESFQEEKTDFPFIQIFTVGAVLKGQSHHQFQDYNIYFQRLLGRKVDGLTVIRSEYVG